MKTLLILRHGKSESHHASGDKGRNLTARGVTDAAVVGKVIAENECLIDLVIASDAERAAQTARLATETMKYAGKIAWTPEVYDASLETLQGIVQSVGDDHKCVLLVGHNPGCEELVSSLVGTAAGEISIPTCGLVRIELKESWSEALPGTGTLAGSWSPIG